MDNSDDVLHTLGPGRNQPACARAVAASAIGTSDARMKDRGALPDAPTHVDRQALAVEAPSRWRRLVRPQGLLVIRR